jgi:hypothetical protein
LESPLSIVGIASLTDRREIGRVDYDEGEERLFLFLRYILESANLEPCANLEHFVVLFLGAAIMTLYKVYRDSSRQMTSIGILE